MEPAIIGDAQVATLPVPASGGLISLVVEHENRGWRVLRAGPTRCSGMDAHRSLVATPLPENSAG